MTALNELDTRTLVTGRPGPTAGPRRRRKRVAHTVVVTLLSVWSLFALAPIVWILMMSLKRPEDIVVYPPKFLFVPTIDNYITVLSGSEFMTPFLNSLIVTAGSLALTLLIGLPAAYALARFQFRGRESIALGILSMRFAPELLIILPLYLLFQKTGLYDSYLGLILAYQLVTLPMLVWMLRSFIEDLPVELEEAVAVDGGNRWTAFRHVLFRLIAPGLGASLMLSFIWAWNSYTLPLVLAGKNTQVITTGIQQYISYQSIDWGPMAAATVVSIIPGILFAVFSLRWIVGGLTAGTVKG
jgi:multiple sugar transport system permease protein